MRRTAVVFAVFGLAAPLAGCGGGGQPSTAAVKPATAPVPDSRTVELALRTAAIQLEAYKLDAHTYTDDETKMGPAFPAAVTIKASDAGGYYMAARDDAGVRYVLRKQDGATSRTCAPPSPDACPSGTW